MTPQEKAKELLNRFQNEVGMFSEHAKNCALICADEILQESPSKMYWQTYDDETPSAITFWHEVKQEIKKL